MQKHCFAVHQQLPALLHVVTDSFRGRRKADGGALIPKFVDFCYPSDLATFLCIFTVA